MCLRQPWEAPAAKAILGYFFEYRGYVDAEGTKMQKTPNLPSSCFRTSLPQPSTYKKGTHIRD